MTVEKLDQVVLVNEQDQPIGVMNLIDAHRGDGMLHRAISVYLFRYRAGRRELLIQQRSDHKIVGSLQWANTACGNVAPGETVEACAYRRLRRELTIVEAVIQPVYKFRYQVRCNADFSENEIDQVFAGWYDGSVTPDPAEVVAIEWVDWDHLKTQAFLPGKLFAPWLVIMLNNRDLIQKLDAVLESTT